MGTAAQYGGQQGRHLGEAHRSENKKLRLFIELNNVHRLVDHSSATTESLYQAHDDGKKNASSFPLCVQCVSEVHSFKLKALNHSLQHINEFYV